MDATEFYINGTTVKMPLGRFLLVRRGSKIGAIRLTSLNFAPNVGEGNSTYEAYFQANGSPSFAAANITRNTGNVNVKPLNFLLFQTGKTRARVGKWSFRFLTPSTMSMWTYRGSQRDYGFQFAPTSACKITEIDILVDHLRWYKFDPDMSVSLPISDPPK